MRGGILLMKGCCSKQFHKGRGALFLKGGHKQTTTLSTGILLGSSKVKRLHRKKQKKKKGRNWVKKGDLSLYLGKNRATSRTMLHLYQVKGEVGYHLKDVNQTVSSRREMLN